MGERGPVPKRDEQRRRQTASPAERLELELTPAEPPDPAPEWHPVARRWWDALTVSPQRRWFIESDWATAFVTTETLSRELKPQWIGVNRHTGEMLYAEKPLGAASFQSFLKACGMLLCTEGDRRRARLELQLRAPDTTGREVADVSWADDARRRLRGEPPPSDPA